MLIGTVNRAWWGGGGVILEPETGRCGVGEGGNLKRQLWGGGGGRVEP